VVILLVILTIYPRQKDNYSNSYLVGVLLFSHVSCKSRIPGNVFQFTLHNKLGNYFAQRGEGINLICKVKRSYLIRTFKTFPL
jgi:hypothetical protein